ncbi:hypothetical protein [Polyangium mundeleinium]|uniref:Uncharacterized protein n=1 Tax=Polyangium mundeleinium TaxID=2995306 RepID=A0ABT5EQL9_9BACT|nr:hypothetical protein [Polyangium mundeleinium]MDC0743478.1 hypothetical protein [Polyangium mundeleinium]
MAKGLTLLFFAAATLFAACSSGDDPATPEQKYCNQRCDCNKCTEVELGSCLDDKINQKDEAADADCKDEYSTYLTCLTGDAACSDGDYDESVCYAEESDLDSCLSPAPTCNLVNNGVCNEPAPKGDGLCAAGSDTKDCAIPTCPSAGDGFCDEPEGSGLCAEGSDPLDCPAETCQTCYDYTLSPNAGPLCETSASVYVAYLECGCGASCVDYCQATLCSGVSPDTDCDSCMAAFCPTEYDACLAD